MVRMRLVLQVAERSLNLNGLADSDRLGGPGYAPYACLMLYACRSSCTSALPHGKGTLTIFYSIKFILDFLLLLRSRLPNNHPHPQASTPSR